MWRGSLERIACALLGLLAGCSPILPFHLAETAETLPKKAVSLTVSGGGGGGNVAYGAGGSARLDVGVGHDQEVGGEISAAGNPGAAVLGGKLRYKLGLDERLALVVGAGVTGTINPESGATSDPAGGADLALVTSTRELERGTRVYGGLRFSFVVPLARDLYASSVGGPTQLFVLPVGVAMPASEHWRLFLELGLVTGVAEYHDHGYRTLGMVGGYGALAVAWTHER